MQEIFTIVKLPMGKEATILEGYGINYFNALESAKGNTNLVTKYLIIELVLIDKKKLEEADIDAMHLRDVIYLMQVISSMMSNDFLKL